MTSLALSSALSKGSVFDVVTATAEMGGSIGENTESLLLNPPIIDQLQPNQNDIGMMPYLDKRWVD